MNEKNNTSAGSASQQDTPVLTLAEAQGTQGKPQALVQKIPEPFAGLAPWREVIEGFYSRKGAKRAKI